MLLDLNEWNLSILRDLSFVFNLVNEIVYVSSETFEATHCLIIALLYYSTRACLEAGECLQIYLII